MFDLNKRIFASRFWGFDPETHPVVMFGSDGHRDRLAKLSDPDDLVLFVGTKDFPTEEHERGKLLGLATFVSIPVNTLDVVQEHHTRDLDFENGAYKWPKAFPLTEAWRFKEPFHNLTDILEHQLPMYATIGVVELSDRDRQAIMALEVEPVDFEKADIVQGLQNQAAALAYARSKQTTGPEATDWTGEVSRTVSGEAFAYVMRFGNSDIWKIGWALSPDDRLKDVNRHIPHEHTKEVWSLPFKQPMPSGEKARDMEQAVLKLLASKRTVGERVKCSETDLKRAWYEAMKA